MNENDNIRVRVLISGTVQMVSFRYYTRKKAQKLELAGWVRNLLDKEKRVEAVFEGPTEKVNEMLEWLEDRENGGSPLSEVLDVDPKPPPDEDSPFPFEEWDDELPEDD